MANAPPNHVHQTTIAEASSELRGVAAFDGCNDATCGVDGLSRAPVYILEYQLGDPIIRSMQPTFEKNTANALVRRPLCDQFLLPDVFHHGEGIPSSEELDLDSNPMFIVLSGRVEIHTPAFDPYHYSDPPRLPLPLSVLGPGSVFGVFEMDPRSSSNPNWVAYKADVTAGWRTAVCLSKFGNDEVRRELAPRSKQRLNNDAGGLLRETFRTFEIPYPIRIAVLPRDTVRLLFDHNIHFVKNSYYALSDALDLHFSLSPLGGGMFRRGLDTSGKTKSDEKKQRAAAIAEMFHDKIAMPLHQGRLTSLIPCTCFEELKPWWKELNRRADKVKHGVRLPALFYVAGHGDPVIQSLKNGPDHPLYGPMLTKEMIDLYTMGGGYADELDSVSQIKHQAVSGDKSELKHFFDQLARQYLGEPLKARVPEDLNNRLYKVLPPRQGEVNHHARSLQPNTILLGDAPV